MNDDRVGYESESVVVLGENRGRAVFVVRVEVEVEIEVEAFGGKEKGKRRQGRKRGAKVKGRTKTKRMWGGEREEGRLDWRDWSRPPSEMEEQ